MKLLLFLLSLVISGVAFVSLDWLSSVLLRKRSTGGTNPKQLSCMVPDPVRHHALRANFSCVNGWGKDSYQVFTNSLGFRDEMIREVPLKSARPRILMLGDSFTEGMIAWRNGYVGQIAAHFPQYEFLNGGVQSYSPSNYLNVTRKLLAEGVEFDEVVVFIDMSDTNDEAAYYRDVDGSGAVTGPEHTRTNITGYSRFRFGIRNHLPLSNHILEIVERNLVKHGYFHLLTGEQYGDVFDMERSAWTYRKVADSLPYPAGYAPLGLDKGLAKEKEKMTLLWKELASRKIPISVVVYPWPAQIVHDTADSMHVRIWRDWCRGKCARFISVFPAFFAVKEQCSRTSPGCWYAGYFVVGDVHYNAAGYALVAGEVIKSIETSPVKKSRSEGATP